MSKSSPIAFLLLLASGLMATSLAQAGPTPTPNLVFIIADDRTFRDIGCYGGQARTPHIDGLAKEGMRFTRCFQTAPMCSPTRHNIYTGLYPVKSGAYPNHTFAKDGTKSIVHYLKPLGYRVALSGKKHISGNGVDRQLVDLSSSGQTLMTASAIAILDDHVIFLGLKRSSISIRVDSPVSFLNDVLCP